MSRKFVRTVDKKKIPICPIMGVNIAAINMEWLLDYTMQNLKELSGDYMCVANVHTTVIAYEDHEYMKVQNGGIMAIPDGAPLSIIGKKRGYKYMSRTAGPSYMESVFTISVGKGWRHFFFGSTEETLDKLKMVLEKKYKGIEIAGMYSPPFRQLTDVEDVEIIERINSTNPDFVWVALGAPKQEKWMAYHQGRLKGFMVGVGAAFDYFVGNLERAPEWMQKNSMEWIYRLIQEPKRLFQRYWYTNTKFIWNAYIKGK